jgi:hypothetical protein
MPYRLPPETGDFTGRARAAAELAAALTRAAAMPVATVIGMSGVGKTALAVHVAHAIGRRFPAGRLYVDLRGMSDHPAEPCEVLGGLLRELGRTDLPDGLDERAALYRSELAGHRFLVLLDDARSAAQVRPLLPGVAGSAALVTSRASTACPPGAWRVDLDVLEPGESLALLASSTGPDRVAAERGAALDLVAACGFLPLAIRAAGTWLATHPHSAIAGLVRRLARGRMDDLPAAVASFRRGYERLGVDERRAFRLLALADGPGFSTGAAVAALGVRRHRADDLLESLADRSLIECPAPDRYRYHDLLRAFALSRACAPGERAPALHALLDHYLTSVREAARALGRVAGPAGTPRRLTGPEAARAWLFVEHGAILSAIERAAEEPDAPIALAADLLSVVTDLLDPEWSPAQVRSATGALRRATAGPVSTGSGSA